MYNGIRTTSNKGEGGYYDSEKRNPHSRTPHQQQKHPPFSIRFDRAINPAYKSVSCKETHSTGQESVDSTSETGVSEEEKRRNETLDVKMVEVVVGAVSENPETAGGANEETVPPPVVVLLM